MATPLPFNANWYLQQNPDVAAAIAAGAPFNAQEHFTQYGRTEGRSASPLFDPQRYLANNPDVADAVAQGLITAWDHFELFGGAEGRSPTPLFDPDFYLQQNPDVAEAVANGHIGSAVQHFLLFGQAEPRIINPAIDLGSYLNANPDLAQAFADGLINVFDHLTQFGVGEGRPLGNGVNLSVFANDAAFTQALSNGNGIDALVRVQEVAPFIPTFVRPAGWAPAANTPIPVDFVPPVGSGITLVVPPEVVVRPDVVLPPAFAPQVPAAPETRPAPETPPEPEAPPSSGADGDGGSTVPTFRVTNGAGDDVGRWVVGTQNGNVAVAIDGSYLVFTPTTGEAQRVALTDITKGLVVNSITLTGRAADLNGGLITGTGTVVVTELKDDVDLSGLSSALNVIADIERSLNISANSTLATVDAYRVAADQILTLTSAQADSKSLTGAGALIVIGSDGNETITAFTSGNSHISGGDGNDMISGGAGDDIVNGGAGDDMISGGDGNDILRGDAGNDTLNPGFGNDKIVYNDVAVEGGDTIINFTTHLDGATFGQGADKLQFSTANLTGIAGFVGYGGSGSAVGLSDTTMVEFVARTGDALVASGAEAAFLFDTTSGQLSFDADGTGDGEAIVIATLTGVSDLDTFDFVFT